MPVENKELDDEVPIGVAGLLEASSKLLHINRGLVEQDHRDSPRYKYYMPPDELMRERVRLDASKSRRMLMNVAAKRRNLSGLSPFHFNDDVEGLITGTSLFTPIEEINPMAIVTSAHRVSAMGPGGINSDDAITDDMQSVQAGSFGFICPLTGPESGRIGVDARFTHGSKLGSDGKIYQRFTDKKSGNVRWLSPSDTANMVVGHPE